MPIFSSTIPLSPSELLGILEEIGTEANDETCFELVELEPKERKPYDYKVHGRIRIVKENIFVAKFVIIGDFDPRLGIKQHSILDFFSEEHSWNNFAPIIMHIYSEIERRGLAMSPLDGFSLIPAQQNNNKHGRPLLTRSELIDRLAKAEEAEEIKAAYPEMRWKEIAEEVKFNKGGSVRSNVKLLEVARNRLKEAIDEKDIDLLKRIRAWRKEKMERKE